MGQWMDKRRTHLEILLETTEILVASSQICRNRYLDTFFSMNAF